LTSTNVSNIVPQRSEIWLINLDPTVGSEIRKTRPAIVVSADAVGVLPVKLIVPLTSWNESYRDKLWLIEVTPTRTNGLAKPSAADVLQLRSVALERFISRIGRMPASQMNEIAAAIALVVELQI
jgi:mRNA interferase MazF